MSYLLAIPASRKKTVFHYLPNMPIALAPMADSGNFLQVKNLSYTIWQEKVIISTTQKNNVGDINDQFLHSQFLALVDRSGQVRGIYDGLKEKEMAQLKGDIDDLLKEAGGTVFVNGTFGNNPGR